MKRLPAFAEALGVELEARFVPTAAKPMNERATSLLLRLLEVLPEVPKDRLGLLEAQIEAWEMDYPRGTSGRPEPGTG
jgi:hypothetical protein